MLLYGILKPDCLQYYHSCGELKITNIFYKLLCPPPPPQEGLYSYQSEKKITVNIRVLYSSTASV